jgi:hypothetical protein
MPFTATQLTTFYTNENLGITPTAAETLLIQAYANQSAAGLLSDAQAIANVTAFAQDKTDVALATYQFFSGATPTLAGLSFLVHGGGNANDLSSAFYAGFNKENRYYNFAINLALDPASANSAAFAASYGSLTFAQAVQVAYENIVGTAVVGAAGAAAAIASITASQSFFQSIAASRATTSNQDLATKAIMIGYILEEAQKADVGVYAKGIDQFDSALAQTGTALTGNLLVNYPLTPQGAQTFVLTTGIDNFVGGPANDIFNATISATSNPLGGLDVVDGGGGLNTFNIADTATLPAAALTFPVGFTQKNIQIENITTNGNVGAVGADQDFSGLALTNLNIVAAGTAGDFVKVAATTNVNVTAAAQPVVVDGGNNVSVADVGGAVTVEGAALSTVTVAGAVGPVVNNGSATGTPDGAGTTLTSVTLVGTTGGATLGGKALTSVNLQSMTVAQTVTVNNAAAAGHTLTIGASAAGKISTGVAITVADATATAITVNSTGTSNDLTLTAASAKALTFTGSGTVVVNPSVLNAGLTKIDGTAATGNVTLTDSFVGATVNMGSGNDTVIVTGNLTAAAGAAINLGAGNNVLGFLGGSIGAGVIVNGGVGGVNTISAALVNNGNAAGISNFQVLDVSSFGATAGNGALDTSLLGSPIGGVSIGSAATAGTATLLNLSAAVTVTDLVASVTPNSSLVLTHAAGAGTLAVAMGNAATAGNEFLAITSTGDTTVSVSSGGKGASTNIFALSETDNHLTTVTVTGADSLTIAANTLETNIGASAGAATNVASSLTTIDASATTGGVHITAGLSNTTSLVTTTYAGLTILGGVGGDSIQNDAKLGVITEGATTTAGVFNTLTVTNVGATINDGASAGADVVNLSGIADTANLGSGAGVVVNVASFGALPINAVGATDTVHFGTGTAIVTDAILYDVAASAVSASTLGNQLALTGTLHAETLQFGVAPANVAGALGAAANVGAAQTFDQAVFTADGAAGAVNTVDWFQYGGNTYILDTGVAAGTADDLLVKITGVVDLSHTTVTAGHALVFA